jgi:uncharacterized protein (TIGR03790 family)
MIVPIRQFITSNHLNRTVTCIVTFYGVPLRIPSRANSIDLRAELVTIRKQIRAATVQAQSLTESLEKLATQADPTFTPLTAPPTVDPAEVLPRRAERAGNSLTVKLRTMSPGPAFDDLQSKVKAISEQFRAPVQIADGLFPQTPPPANQQALTPQQVSERMLELSFHRGDPAARRAFRDLVRDHAGILVFLQIASAQEQYLTPDESEAAVDNELAALWWGLYPRFRWQANPLNYKIADRSGKPTMMVMRLDGGNAEQVHGMIDTSIKVEAAGLQGKVALDSRGIPLHSLSGKSDGYGAYDQTIRNCATLLREHTKVDLVADDHPELIPLGSADDCAVYCGWYSPGRFVKSVTLVPGAVAAHIASFEMTTLHNPTGDWCRNLLDGGAVATFGPVGEPYLHAFPTADEFFPLLLTGKLTLAEIYWATNPLISWKMTMVGDPLYTPFKVNPALMTEDLPTPLQAIFAAHDR